MVQVKVLADLKRELADLRKRDPEAYAAVRVIIRRLVEKSSTRG